MRLNLKTGGAVAALWIVTLFAAYHAGGGSEGSPAVAGQSGDQRGSDASSPGGAGLMATAGSGREGARSLSSSPAGRPGMGGGPGGSAPAKLMRLLDGASGADLRRSEFEEIAENLSLEDVMAVIDQIAAYPAGPAQRDAYREVLARWAQLDADGALQHAATIGAPGLRREATLNVLRHWAEVDPAAAVAYASDAANGDLPTESLSIVFRGIGDSMDTTAALDFLATLQDESQQRFAGQSVRDLFERNDAEVISWAEGLPEGGMRDRALQALAGQWARYDPEAARAWIDRHTDDSNRVGVLAEFGESWARIDPEAAASWAQEQLAGEAQDGGSKVLDRVFRRWMQSDFADAAGYLVDQEPSPALDGAVEQYIQRVKGVDPDSTLAWAESITDPRRRRNAVLMVAKNLRSQDLQAYHDYVESSPIFSEQERDKLLGRTKEREKEKPKGPPKSKDKIKKVKPFVG